MVSVALLIRIAAASMISSAAFAADMPQPLPQPQIQYQPIPVVMEQPQGAWYLRGDIGVGITNNFDFVFLQNPSITAISSSSTRRWPIRCFSTPASGSSGTIGCASTSPPNIAQRPRSMRSAPSLAAAAA
jgi:opacity protein-like surface antigen